MKLLILTQKVDRDDAVLGFFHAWIKIFAEHFDFVTAICLEEGAHSLPENVEVLSLGKEKGVSKWKYIFNFYKYIWSERKNYDVVFVHMNPEYVILGGLFWRLWRKKIGLWYVHRAVNLKLRLATLFSHIIFSTSPEAFQLKTKKVHFLGHGIDFTYFTPKLSMSDVDSFEIIHVGRITPIKNIDILIGAADILRKKWDKNFKITLVGSLGTKEDEEYQNKLKAQIKRLGLEEKIKFIGSVPFEKMQEIYHHVDVSVNLTPTGGMDKVVLESIASGTIALSANKAFENLFNDYVNYLLYKERDAEDVAKKIMVLGDMEQLKRDQINNNLYKRIQKDFSLTRLVGRITQLLNGL